MVAELAAATATGIPEKGELAAITAKYGVAIEARRLSRQRGERLGPHS